MIVTLLVPSSVAAQISPGPLARSHASLEGAAQCLRCHPVGRKDAMDGACVACHREIGWLLDQRRGLHAREGRAKCASCHPDHAGTGFALIAWNADSLSRFDHRRAGWALDGAHRTARCDACHAAEFRRGEVAARAPKPGAGHWTGLETACVSCHADVHRGAVQPACQSCHAVDRWVPAPGFDHDSTDYPLTGRHRNVTCESCHAARAGALRPGASRIDPAFRPLRAAECSGCHADTHAGRLGGACAQCHVTTGFVDRKPGGFDHSKTRYPLRGRHAAVRCDACHAGTVGGKRPAFATCAACHADPHAGTATLAGKPADCAGCHDERAFRPATFTADRHRNTKYPLDGRHATVPCNGCHTKGASSTLGTAGVQLRPASARCGSCHADAHQGQVGSVSGGECSVCHLVQSWTVSSFPAARHAEFEFALDGRHASARCGACHVPAERAVFKLESRECVSCHVDPHQRRDAVCTACHTAAAFRPSTVDVAAHAKFRLSLEGAHLAVPCVACHEEMNRPAAGATLLASAATVAPLRLDHGRTTCAACHRDPHGSQFDQGRVRTCDACHGVEGFKPASRFDHRRDTGFPLDRGHETVSCAQCHVDGRWRGTPTRCEVCHR